MSLITSTSSGKTPVILPAQFITGLHMLAIVVIPKVAAI